MSLTLAMKSAVSSLNAAQLGLQVLSSNVANANTVGYTRKMVSQETRILDGVGAGVFTTNIVRTVDEIIQQQMRVQAGSASQYDTLDLYFQQIQDMFGSLQNSSSFVSGLDKLEAALQALGVTPEGVSQRSDVVNAAQNLTVQLATMGTQLQSLRRQADSEIADAVNVVNAQLDAVDRLNKSIARSTALHLPTGDLEDQRDIAIDKIAQEIDISYFRRDNGEIVIYTKGGRTLLDQQPQHLSHSPTSNINAGITHAGGGVDGIWLGGADITDEITSGHVGALISIRDSDVPNLVSEMDRLTGMLRDSINALHNDGNAFPPPNSLTGTHAFVAADTLVASGNLRIAVADSAGKYVDDGGGNPDYKDIDLSALTTAVGGTLTVQNVIDAINGGVIAGFSGVPNVTARLTNGNLVIQANNPAYGVIVDGSDVDGSLGINGSVNAAGVTLGGDITAFPTPTITLATNGISSAAGTALQALMVNGNLDLAMETTAGAPGALRLAANSRFTFGPVGGAAGSSLALPINTASADVAAGGTVEIGFDSDGNGTSDTVIGTMTFGAATLAGATAGGAQGSIAVQGINISRNTAVRIAGTTQSFNQFFGLNDFFTTGTDYDSYTSAPQSNAASPLNLTGTLSFSGIFGATTVNYAGTDTLTALAAAINANGALSAANIKASVVLDGSNVRLKIKDSDGNNFTLTDSSTLLSTLNFNTDTTGIVQALQVRPALAQNLGLIARGQLDTTNAPAIGNAAITNGDGSVIQNMANAFTSQLSFAAAGALGPTSNTFGGYATSILSLNAVQAANISSTQKFKAALVQDYKTKVASNSGVNIDEELAHMIVLQNAYAASARVITTASDMLKTLNDIV